MRLTNSLRMEMRVSLFCAVSLAAIARGGDSDSDGVDDALDECCNTPMGVGVNDRGRPAGDLDGDCQVDLLDFSLFQSSMTGRLSSYCCSDAECDDANACTLDSCTNGACVSQPIPGCGQCSINLPCASEVECDLPLQDVIEPESDSDLHCFCVTGAEVVRIGVIEVTPSDPNFAPNWRLLDASGSPVATCGTFTTTEERDCGVLPLTGSPFRIEVQDSGLNDVGTYRIHLQRLGAGVSCDDVALACDQGIAGSIDDPIDTDLLSFDSAAGEIVRVTVLEDTPSGADFTPTWRLLDAAGHPVGACGNFSTGVTRECGPLPPAGNPFRIQVADSGLNDTGLYVAILQRLSAQRACDSDALPCDTVQQFEIETIGDSDLLSLSIIEGEVVRLSVVEGTPADPSFAPNWRLLDATGAPAQTCGTFSTSSSRDCGTLASAGNPYRIEVEDSGRVDMGPYLVHLQRLTSLRSCASVDLECDLQHIDCVSPKADTDLLRLQAPDGEIVRISVVEQAGGELNFAPNWRLLDTTGSPFGSCGSFSTAQSRDCGPLPFTGNPYQVEVEDSGRVDTGCYAVNIQFLTTGCP